MEKLKVGKCWWCGGTGNVIPRDPLQGEPAKCPQCSGTGRVVGVLPGMITMIDGDTGAVLTFPKMPSDHVQNRIDEWDAPEVENAIEHDTAAVVNRILDGAPKEGNDAG